MLAAVITDTKASVRWLPSSFESIVKYKTYERSDDIGVTSILKQFDIPLLERVLRK